MTGAASRWQTGIFGKKPLFRTETERLASSMPRVAIPTFQSRVSPVFDACTRVLLVDIQQCREVDRNEIYLDQFSLNERMRILQKSKVTTVICGGISSTLQHMLQRRKIGLIAGIAGQVDEVLIAYLSHGLHQPRFHMPGSNER